jgi:hypothetical protein
MTKRIIAFCGLAGSGKDTACDYLVDRDYKKISFASPLKQMAKIAFGFTDEQLYGSSSKREEQDLRYPFSGICVACGKQCSMRKDDTKVWECFSCMREYPMFVSARLALQTLGTEWGRRLTSDLWAQAAVNQILASDYNLWCISDLRFKNEMKAVRDAGGVVVRLMRGKAMHNHASEQELLSIPVSEFDWVIHNHGDLADLYMALDSILDHIAVHARVTGR